MANKVPEWSMIVTAVLALSACTDSTGPSYRVLPGVDELLIVDAAAKPALIREDGAAVRSYPAAPSVSHGLTWATDAHGFTYTSRNEMDREDLIAVQADGSRSRVLLAGWTRITPLGFRGSSTSGSIIFWGTDPNLRWGLWQIGADGRGLRMLSEGEAIVSPLGLSPDGRRLAWASDAGYWVGNVDGSSARQIKMPANRIKVLRDREDIVAWSPDGAWLVFVVGILRQDYNLDPEGGELLRVSSGGGDAAHVTSLDGPWSHQISVSPDGQWIAFHTHNAGYVITADGTGRRRVAESVRGRLEWSADAEELAFSTAEGIVVAKADGTERRIVAPHPAHMPQWRLRTR